MGMQLRWHGTEMGPQCGTWLGRIPSHGGLSTPLQTRLDESGWCLCRHKDFPVVLETERREIHEQAVPIWKREQDVADCVVLFQNGTTEDMKRLLKRGAVVGCKLFEDQKSRLLPAIVKVDIGIEV